MAREHVVKFYARQIQKGSYLESDVPEQYRKDAVELAKTLPLREDMIEQKSDSIAEESKDKE
jgi:hypothetical protein